MLIRKSESASSSTLVADHAQNVYELVVVSYGQRPSELAEQYRLVGETYFAFQWANSIGLNDFQWHQIFSGLLAHIHSNSIAHEVAELIASGKVCVYELPSIKSSGAIPFDEKSAYQFFPSVVTQYAASPYRLEKFNSVAKAQAFVNGIKWSGSALARVASDLRMDQIIQQKIIKNGNSNLEFGKQEIIKLLSEGKAVVLKVERITASPSKKSAAELVPLRTNDKPPPLAPETKNTEAVQEEKKSELDARKDVKPESSSDSTINLKQTGSGVFTGAADELYDAIRASETDVSTIASNTGIKPQNIQKVKDHVFYNEHLLDRYVDYGIPAEKARFDSDLTQANAWFRLESGTHTQADINWLKHEAAERWFELKYNSGYSTAHNAAEKRWPGNPWGN